MEMFLTFISLFVSTVAQLLTRFDFDVIDCIRARFLWADLDMSGGLTAIGFAKVLVEMRVTVSNFQIDTVPHGALDYISL